MVICINYASIMSVESVQSIGSAAAELLQRASTTYLCGRYEECEECLRRVSVMPFSRLQWALESNQLACQTQRAVAAGNLKQVEDIRRKYSLLWEKIRGLPPSPSHHPLPGLPPSPSTILTEVVVVCALCQLMLTVRVCGGAPSGTRLNWGIQQCHSVTERVCRCLGVPLGATATALPTLVSQLRELPAAGSLSAKCLLKLAYLEALSHALLGEREEAKSVFQAIHNTLQVPEEEDHGGVFDRALRVKHALESAVEERGSECSTSDSELKYSEAWHQYTSGQYGESLSTLHPLLQGKPHPHTITMATLLAGGCYTNTGKPTLALCSYHRCVRGSSETALSPSLHNCAMVFRRLGDGEGEEGMRDLLIEALGVKEETSSCQTPVLWRTEEGSISLHPALPSFLTLLHATYTSACRALQQGRYKLATASLTQITTTLENGRTAIPPSLPPPSTLYLLCIKARLCSGECDGVEVMCARLVETLLPSVMAEQATGDGGRGEGVECEVLQHTLALAQAFFFRATAAVHSNRITDGKHHCEKSLRLVRFLLLRLTEDTHPNNMITVTRQLQAHSLNMLALIHTGRGQYKNALTVLAEGVASTDPAPLLVFNHALLLCRMGRVLEAAHSWLGLRGGLPQGVKEGRERLGEARKTMSRSLRRSERESQFTALDVAMLGVWTRHAR